MINSECKVICGLYTSVLTLVCVSGLHIFALGLLFLCPLAFADNMDRFCSNIASGRFVSNPRSCQHWIFCNEGLATEGQCPGIYYFDESSQMCRYRDFVECNFDAVDVTCSTTDDLETHSHPENCNQYVVCVDGFPRVQNCADGLYWDQANGRCDFPTNVECHIQEPDRELIYYCEPDTVYVTRHPFECQKFIVCVNGDRRLNRCAENLLFDPKNLRCDLEANVDCVLPEAEVDYECDPTRDLYFAPHPTSCDYYLVCFAGHRQLRRCAEGLRFDWITNQCNVPENAFCLAPVNL